ncbi:hypothetical protein [Nonomuraea typhae]|uniref:Uncharacterized protein n=1 Tax=Nonomuraea typhae TaxID=2603600 RepID=A0ABW7YZ29_9ACTN|nr:hypothetical protein [Nonomuraea typhae]
MEPGFFIIMLALGVLVVGGIGVATVFIVLSGIKSGQWPTLKR